MLTHSQGVKQVKMQLFIYSILLIHFFLTWKLFQTNKPPLIKKRVLFCAGLVPIIGPLIIKSFIDARKPIGGTASPQVKKLREKDKNSGAAINNCPPTV